MGDLDDVGKTTSETGQAMTAYLGDDGDDLLQMHGMSLLIPPLHIFLSINLFDCSQLADRIGDENIVLKQF